MLSSMTTTTHSSTTEKVRENRLRRMAERQGLALRKSRTRDPRALNYGVYWLEDESGDVIDPPGSGKGTDRVEAYLTGGDA